MNVGMIELLIVRSEQWKAEVQATASEVPCKTTGIIFIENRRHTSILNCTSFLLESYLIS